ncbi:response regulator [Clostridium folliculivorans]|uniref:Stage 0 sporulation protein A homolog n=1 Tax=Clostridium folliculivorans TaxID=2886038 RepID=A0A9W5Y478_9CLOT|nr:response regulator [Clostridium folliculivorans]GKU26260.1 response regulator [Clostridium folliculivorans]GKU31932.1 response regulator [Clostridium folliculivorans]
MKKLMIVDDDNNIRLLIKQTLEELEDIEISEANNAEDALYMVQQIKPDLILLDVNLPNMNGYQFVEKIKQSPELENIKIFMITAKAQEKEINRGIGLGANLYITKPFDPEYLLINTCEYLNINIE